MDLTMLPIYIFVFLLGICVGSFCNVCILRIPAGESIVTTPSHCMHCGKRLRWYELIPLFSWLALRGRCSGCHSPISVQYPLIEAANGALWLLVYHRFGLTPDTLLGCLFASVLLVASVIDARTRELPPGTTIAVAVLGLLRCFSIFPTGRSWRWAVSRQRRAAAGAAGLRRPAESAAET
jgi:leader peptidase (prepilin peptidase)/N-methyltransferase